MIQELILRLCPQHEALKLENIELRHKLEILEGNLEMEQFRREQARARVAQPKDQKAPVIKTAGWRQFQSVVANLEEKTEQNA